MPSTSSTRPASSLAEGAAGPAPRPARGASLRRQDRLPVRHIAGRGQRRVRGRRPPSPMPPSSRPGAWPSSARPCRKAATGWPRVSPASPPSAGCVGQHRFIRYKKPKDDRGPRVLLTKDAAAIDETVRLAEATALVRDLVDTPPADMGPAELERTARDLARSMAPISTSPPARRWPRAIR